MLKMDVVEMKMLRWMCGTRKKDKIRNDQFQEHLGVSSIGDKIRKKNSFERVWACPAKVSNNAGKEMFGYASLDYL